MTDYGTRHEPSETVVTTVLADEEQPLSFLQKVHQYMDNELDPKHADALLLLSYVATGLVDSCAVRTWGSFVSMQTGNTVYIGLGLAALDQPDQESNRRWIKSLSSLVCFGFGTFCFSRYHAKFHERRRWVLTLSFLVQLVCVLIAYGVVRGGAYYAQEMEKRPPLHWQVIVPIALVSFQSSAQALVSRALGFRSLTSVVLTSIYIDIFSDPDLFTLAWRGHAERNRRLFAPLLLLCGAFLGGQWAESDTGMAGALLSVVFLKAFITFMFIVWPKEKN
ncbi:Protein of unknown function (DUF1275), putative [Angomonas deanei]|uniref:DUF1275 domain protein n=1 Tax=Angomonas deanei TaxID=59799 RepID=A0A7G2C284_9TRYP|nr:Protein of unknown function (DUF1275), putative [Angomonas deanei]